MGYEEHVMSGGTRDQGMCATCPKLAAAGYVEHLLPTWLHCWRYEEHVPGGWDF